MKPSFYKLCAVAGSLATILVRTDRAHALGCYIYETDYFGYDIHKILEGPATESIEHCQQACQANNLCAHWTYVAQRKQCYLKDSNAVRSAVSNPLAISGPRFCPKPEAATCFEHGTDYHGYDMEKIENGTIVTPESCQQLCQSKPGCTYWTFIRGKKNCYLKSGPAFWGRVRNVEAISGPRSCDTDPQQICQEKDIDYAGHDIQAVENHMVESPEKCQGLCQSSPNCRFWTWVSSQKNCYLKDENAPAGRTHVLGCVSGPRLCDGQGSSPPDSTSASSKSLPPVEASSTAKALVQQAPVFTQRLSPLLKSCHDHNVMYKGQDLVTLPNVKDHEDCQDNCRKHDGCMYFTFYTDDGKCALKATMEQAVSHNNAVSGKKFCTGLVASQCLKEDVEIHGRDIALTAVSSTYVCEELCHVNVLCASYSYNKEMKLCIQRQQEGPALGVISGYKNCQRRDRGLERNTAAPVDRCYSESFALTGPGVGIMDQVASPEECQQLCRRDFLCWSFTYSSKGKKCLLQAWGGEQIPQIGAMSGAKYCPATITPTPLREGYLEDYELYGKELSATVTVSAEACYKLCQANDSCAVWAFHTESQICSQRQREAFSLRTASGYKHCWS